LTSQLENPCVLCGRRRPGRKKTELPVLVILDALSKGKTVTQVATELGISRPSVYRVMDKARERANPNVASEAHRETPLPSVV